MAKDSPRTTAGEIVESRGQKTLKKRSNSTHITTYCLGGFQEKNQEKLQHIQLSDITGTSNGTGFYGQIKLKHELFISKHFGEHGDKKYPMCTMKYTAVFLIL